MKPTKLICLLIYFMLISVAYPQNPHLGFQEYIVTDISFSTEYPKKIQDVDVDGDGDKDVFVSFSSKIAWYENLDGQGKFGKQKLIKDTSYGVNSFWHSDMDNDGDVDVIYADIYGFYWIENLNGQGDFGQEQSIDNYSTDHTAIYIPTDVDGNGFIDIVIANDEIVWYKNLGNGTFDSQQIISSFGAESAYTHDMDADSDMDLMVGINGEIVWYENTDGLGNFSSQSLINTPNSIQLIYGSDVDADGDDDIISVFSNTTLAWFENLGGSSGFGSSQTISTNITYMHSLQTTDMDGDGDMDILAVNSNSSIGFDEVLWYENSNGQGNFTGPHIIDDGEATFFADAGDIDGDGDMDVLKASGNDTLSWFENTNGQGVFSLPNFIGPNGTANSVATGDLDGDGDKDIVAGIQPLTWFENLDGQGNFGPGHVVDNTLEAISDVYIKDIDSDGDLDLIINYGFKLIWYANNGLGTFGNGNIIETIIYTDYFQTLNVDDLDGDGDLDILSNEGNEVFWYENTDGNGTFGGRQIVINTSSWGVLIQIADVDSDGDLDVLTTSGVDEVLWYENNGSLSFSTPKTIVDYPQSTFENLYSFASDIDNDSDLDLILSTNKGDSIVWFPNNGQGVFGNKQIVSASVDKPSLLESIDIDGDGDKDIAAISYSGGAEDELIWYENLDGQGNFGASQLITINLYARIKDIHIDDMDGDGYADFITASFDDHKIAWYENMGFTGNQINGVVQIDTNGNGCSNNAIPAQNIMVTTDNGTNTFSTFTLSDGSYGLNINDGNFSTNVGSNFPTYFSVTPNSYSSNFTGLGNTDTGNFCISAGSTINDLNISIYPLTDARPGFDAEYQLVYRNMGTTILSGNVDLGFDDAKLTFLSASETPTSQTNNTLSFDYSNLNPFETRTIDLKFTVAIPPTTNIDDILTFVATVNPVTGDNTQADNSIQFDQIVIGSYDPNDIRVVEGDEIYLSQADEYLHYIIRFQNTGTASALSVRVTNILDPKLDWGTFQLENLSHSGRVEIKDGNQVEFIFENINLPDSNSDEPGSHGFIQYKIKPKASVAVNDMISNTADIFFDFNPPITTNTATTTIVQDMSVKDFVENRVKVYPVPSSGVLNIESNSKISKLKVYNHLGQMLIKLQDRNGIETLNIQKLSNGIYFLKMEDGKGNSYVKKIVKG